ncbi:MAG TPA: tetratricopeptide repeat protein [Candidatus Saccharimonadia bacterium]|nr:tetratricopeptide repeat protein [Candidatus Saccharimonadia bacterium]
MNASDIAAYAEAAAQGRFDEAERGLELVLQREPGHVEAHALAAWIANARGDDAACERRLAIVLEHEPDHRSALAIALSLANRRQEPDRAIALARRLTALEPAAAWAHYNLGSTLAMHGDVAGARASLAHALELDPGFTEALRARAWLALEARDFDAARADFLRALSLEPRNPAVVVELGMLELRRYDGTAARLHFEHATRLDARDASAWRGLSQALELSGAGHRDAIDASARAVALAPHDAAGWFEHAKCLSRTGHVAEARNAAVHALERRPEWLEPRWLLFQALPYPLADHADTERSRRIWRAGLAAFEALPLDDDGMRGRLAGLLTLQSNFHRHYLGDDLTDDQKRYGALVARMAGAAFETERAPSTCAARGRRMRIGFASAHLRRHTIHKLFHQWIARLDRGTFEVVAIYLGATIDDEVRGLAAIADEVIGPIHTNQGWIDALHAARLDALVWLDIGMDGLTQLLAPMRFAPLQCATWGHPVTTGLPSIDAFISGEAMEPANGESHYSERLVRLPGLGIAYAPPDAAQAHVRMPRSGVPARYVCAQSIHKLLPVHDALFARVLANAPGSTLALAPHPVPEVRERLAARMRPVFAGYGVDFDDRVRLHPHLSESRFLELLRDADVLLDSVGWSGGNTTLEALAFDLPAVTLPGAYMRARHTHGIVSLLGLADRLSARDLGDYVAIATRLGTDARYHASIAEELASRKHFVFDGDAAVQALEGFLAAAVRERG